MRSIQHSVLALLCLAIMACNSQADTNYQFDGSISREILENYLSRAVTHNSLCGTDASPSNFFFAEDLRLLTNIGAKFIGRANVLWIIPADIEYYFQDAHTHGIAVGGQSLFDSHAFPLRIAEVAGKPTKGKLVMWLRDSIYGRSLGGVTPSG